MVLYNETAQLTMEKFHPYRRTIIITLVALSMNTYRIMNRLSHLPSFELWLGLFVLNWLGKVSNNSRCDSYRLPRRHRTFSNIRYSIFDYKEAQIVM